MCLGKWSMVCSVLTSWPRGSAGACFANGWFYPKPALQRALLPTLQQLDTMRAFTAVHVRLGFVDWAQRATAAQLLLNESLSSSQAWTELEAALEDCRSKAKEPCVRWGSFDRGYGGPGSEQTVRKVTPTLQYVQQSSRCGHMVTLASAASLSIALMLLQALV